MGTTRIVYAPRPAKLKGPVVRRTVVPLVTEPAPVVSEAPASDMVPSREALDAFTGMLERWRLQAGVGWQMLTGKPSRPRALTEDQARQVQILLAIEAMLSAILTRMDVGTWMVERNPGPLLAGQSPVDYLTEVGMPGYVSLLRQVQRWAEM